VETLALSGMEAEVRIQLRESASTVADLQTTDIDLESSGVGAVVDQVRAFRERLQAQEATSADGRQLGKLLVVSAIALDAARAEDGAVGAVIPLGALAILEQALPTADRVARSRVANALRLMAGELPGLIEHAEADFEYDAAHESEEPDEEPEEEDEEGEFVLDERISDLDLRLSVTEEAGEAADVAYELAIALLVQGLEAMGAHPYAYGHQSRAMAAAHALMSTGASDNETFRRDAGAAAILTDDAYGRAVALLEADVPRQPPAPESAEVLLPEFDSVLDAMRDVANSELVDELGGGLALVSGAAQVLWLGVLLNHEDADLRRRMAAALGTLDPLALASLPEARALAIDGLRELLKGTGGSAGPL
jgi:hypothetical protein